MASIVHLCPARALAYKKCTDIASAFTNLLSLLGSALGDKKAVLGVGVGRVIGDEGEKAQESREGFVVEAEVEVERERRTQVLVFEVSVGGRIVLQADKGEGGHFREEQRDLLRPKDVERPGMHREREKSGMAEVYSRE